ncbi:hypothetical protein [Corynebacterium aquilae]|uniref:hypothetical protein n=1 Tax=Corynebacterium aquilae TaxID=203263 RepID=UPI0009515760|nr:hypothetical protein [Corynebacterium aquilae]
MPSTHPRHLAVVAGVVIVGLSVLWPFLLPGGLLARDMVVLGHMALSDQATGFSVLPARAAPQDGFLALIPFGLAPLVARALVLSSAWWGARAAWRIGGPVAAILLLANPFVVSRLLQGHWSLVVAFFALAVLTYEFCASPRPRWLLVALAMWMASLTPTGAVFAIVVALLLATSWRHRLILLAIGGALSLPWLVPSVLASSRGASITATAASFVAFAPRGQGPMGVVLNVLGTGGIWNTSADLASRSGVFSVSVLAGALVTVLLLVAGWRTPRSVPRQLWALGVFALFATCLVGLFPSTAGALLSPLPGSGLIRDGQKLVMLALPALLLGVRPAIDMLCTWLSRVPTKAVAAQALLAALLVINVWGAPFAMRQITPIPEPRMDFLAQQVGDRMLLIVPGSTTVSFHDRTIVDPRTKAMSVLSSGELIVDGEVVDPPNPAYISAVNAWNAHDMSALQALGVGVVLDEKTGALTEVPGAQPARPQLMGVMLCALWSLTGVVLCGTWAASSWLASRR